MPAIRTIRRDLGLSTGDLLVLGALLSFLPCKDRETGAERPIGPDMVVVVFASNAVLCDRANGMDERVLRRHLARLSDAGLIRRKQSATGKRFPLKRDGVIRDAFGIDLTPLLERHPELISMSEETRIRKEELRAARAEALALRAQALETADPHDDETWSFLQHAKTVLRRASLTVDRVMELIEAISRLVTGGSVPQPEAPCPASGPAPLEVPDNAALPDQARDENPLEHRQGPRSGTEKDRRRPSELSGGDGRNVRQQDPSQIDIKKRRRPTDMRSLWDRCQMVAIIHPEPPETEEGLLRVIHEFGQMTRFDDRTLAEAVRSLGARRLIEVLNYIGQNGATIRCRYSYLGRIMQRKGASPQGSPRTASLG
jgi:replication initiation protein RepC